MVSAQAVAATPTMHHPNTNWLPEDKTRVVFSSENPLHIVLQIVADLFGRLFQNVFLLIFSIQKTTDIVLQIVADLFDRLFQNVFLLIFSIQKTTDIVLWFVADLFDRQSQNTDRALINVLPYHAALINRIYRQKGGSYCKNLLAIVQPEAHKSTASEEIGNKVKEAQQMFPKRKEVQTAAVQRYNWTLTFYNWAMFLSVLGSSLSAFASTLQLTYGVEGLSAPLALVISTVASGIPSVVFPLFGGMLGDRISRRAVVLSTQILLTGQALLLWQFHAEVLVLWILGATASIASALSQPAQAALVQELKGTEKLHKALAINDAFRHSAWIVSYAVSSLFVFQGGDAWLYLVDAGSFVPIAVLVALLKTGREVTPRSKITLRDAIAYLATEKTASLALMGYAIVALCIGGGYVVQSLIAAEVFSSKQVYIGFAVMNTLGGLLGSLVVKNMKHPSLRWVLGAGGASALFLFAMALAAALHGLMFTFVFLLGECIMYVICSRNATPLVQEGVPNHLQERVIGTIQSLLSGCTMISNLIAGLLTLLVGIEPTLMLMAAAGIIAIGLYSAMISARQHLIRAVFTVGLIWSVILIRLRQLTT
jgi:MFS family permease